MHRIIRTHGKEATKEMLDMVMLDIKDMEKWMKFAKKYKIVGRGTKYLFPRITKVLKTHRYQEQSGGGYARVEVDEPYTDYAISLRNGNHQVKFIESFTSEELPQILEELKE